MPSFTDSRARLGRALLTVLIIAMTAAIRPAAGSGSDQTLRLAMRKLWEDHITWTRLVIVSTAGNLPDLEPTTARLMQNQTDIGNAIKPYYGDAAGDRLTTLLKAHISGAADILAAAKASDNDKVTAANAAWHANADSIAMFLSGANPKSWPLDEMKAMMREHLDLTLTEAQDQLKGNYAASVADYDRVHEQILKMADELTEGIVQQHPKKFSAKGTSAAKPKK